MDKKIASASQKSRFSLCSRTLQQLQLLQYLSLKFSRMRLDLRFLFTGIDHLPETQRQEYIGKGCRLQEIRSHFFCQITGYTAPDGGYVEFQFLVLSGERSEPFYGRNHILQTLHRGNAIGLTLQPFADPLYGPELFHRCTGCTSQMIALKVTAKDKHLSGFQHTNPGRSNTGGQQPVTSTLTPAKFFFCIIIRDCLEMLRIS